jgi:acetolactate synthase-1/2/3 large subunit
MTDIQKLAFKLKEYNYQVAFGITGSGPSYSLLNLLSETGIKYVTVSNESVAAVAAGTYNYHYKQKAFCISIKGPGFANALSGLIACYFERFNVVSISEDYATNSSNEAMHKRLNQTHLVSNIATQILSLSHLNEIDNFLVDNHLNPSPKHFELAHVEFKKCETSFKQLQLEDSQFVELKQTILNAKKPILICGSLCYRLDLQSLINSLKLPIFTTTQAKGLLDENSKNSCGIYTGVGEELVPENELINESDCVITIGLKNQEILGVSNKGKFINFDISTKAEFEHTQYCSENQIKMIFNYLFIHTNWAENIILKYKSKLADYVKSYTWMPANAFESINKLCGKMTMVLDTGFFCTVGEHVYIANSVKRFMGSSNGRNMGLSVPMALGIAIKNEPVVCCFGDGGIRYHIGDIRTIIELNLPVCFVLFSDGFYGSVASYVDEDNVNIDLVKPFGVDWSPIFIALNVRTRVITNAVEFESFLLSWDMKTPMFIEAKFDYLIYREITKKLRK